MHVMVDIGVGGCGLLVVGAFVIGVVAQWIGIAEGEDDWQPVMVGAFVGGVIGSEWLMTLAPFGPVWNGVSVLPALMGGALVGAIAALITFVVSAKAHPEGGAHT